MAIFWTAILYRINCLSISLQKLSIELRTAVNLLKYLRDFLLSHPELFDYYEMKANDKTDNQNSDENQRVRSRKRHRDDRSPKDILLKEKGKLKIDINLPGLLQKLILCTKFSEHYSEDIKSEFIDEMLPVKYLDAGKDKMVLAKEP